MLVSLVHEMSLGIFTLQMGPAGTFWNECKRIWNIITDYNFSSEVFTCSGWISNIYNYWSSISTSMRSCVSMFACSMQYYSYMQSKNMMSNMCNAWF